MGGNGFVRAASAAIALLLLCAGPAGAGGAPEGAGALPVDPAIVRDVTLPNGFRYLIQRHDRPPGGLTLLLHVEVGSLEEADDERGYAHFVEHMAFNGTEHFPPGELARWFSSI